MELLESDIDRLTRVGYKREDFTVKCDDGIIRLRNIDRKCFFYDSTKKRCRVYSKRPDGCFTYPIVYLEKKGIMIDPLCPMHGTISDQELRWKGQILIRILKMMEKEEKRRII